MPVTDFSISLEIQKKEEDVYFYVIEQEDLASEEVEIKDFGTQVSESQVLSILEEFVESKEEYEKAVHTLEKHGTLYIQYEY